MLIDPTTYQVLQVLPTNLEPDKLQVFLVLRCNVKVNNTFYIEIILKINIFIVKQ